MKSQNKQILKTSIIIILLISIIFLGYGIITFMKGFHNVDLVFNYMHLTTQANIQLLEEKRTDGTIFNDIDNAYDQYETGKKIPLIDLYINGMHQQIIGMIITAFASLLIGASIIMLSDDTK